MIKLFYAVLFVLSGATLKYGGYRDGSAPRVLATGTAILGGYFTFIAIFTTFFVSFSNFYNNYELIFLFVAILFSVFGCFLQYRSGFTSSKHDILAKKLPKTPIIENKVYDTPYNEKSNVIEASLEATVNLAKLLICYLLLFFLAYISSGFDKENAFLIIFIPTLFSCTLLIVIFCEKFLYYIKFPGFKEFNEKNFKASYTIFILLHHMLFITVLKPPKHILSLESGEISKDKHISPLFFYTQPKIFFPYYLFGIPYLFFYIVVVSSSRFDFTFQISSCIDYFLLQEVIILTLYFCIQFSMLIYRLLIKVFILTLTLLNWLFK